MAYVTIGTGVNERMMDVMSRLMRDRIVYLQGVIEDEMANEIVAQLLFLDSEDSKEKIQMWINSPGGSVTAGFAILDAMRFIRSPVETVCIGQACSMAAVLLASGTGKRVANPHSRIMIHQVSAGAGGQATDMEIQVREVLRLKAELNQIVAEATKKTVEVVAKDMERDYYMTAKEAAEYGIVDLVVGSTEGK